MMYLIDTNVISETIKKQPNQNVLNWLFSIDIKSLSLSVLTLGEIRKGVERIEDEAKKQTIIRWLEVDLLQRFYGRIIPIDANVADKWGYLCSLKNMPAVDGLIAASAITHNHKLVTRNIKDFKEIIGLEIINPWDM